MDETGAASLTNSDHNDTSATLDPAFAALLCCPDCRDRPHLAYDARAATLSCGQCHRVYPVVDGLPDLRPNEARTESSDA